VSGLGEGREKWAVGVLGPGLVGLLGFDPFSNSNPNSNSRKMNSNLNLNSHKHSTNKTMLQHDATTKIKPMINFNYL